MRNTFVVAVASWSLLLNISSALVLPLATEVARANFEKYRKAFPASLDVVEAGGWHEIEKLSEDPKAELVSIIKNGLLGSRDDDTKKSKIVFPSEKIETIASILQSRGKGFEAALVDGEWVAVFSKEGKKSPKIQKLVDNRATVKKAYSNFDTKSLSIENINFITPHSRGKLSATVKYNPVATNFERSYDGKSIVLRRIGCDIVNASYKYWKLPKLPLPLRAKGGYLDFVYLDDDIRVTRGSRGGLFVHFRPEFLENVLKEE